MAIGTRERILDAAVESASLYGISRLAVSDVARRAGVSRPTLYKHFPSKDDLVAAAVQREAERLADAVLAAASAHERVDDALRAAIVAALRVTRDHPLLDRLIATEPETLVPLIVSDGGPVTRLVRTTVDRMVAQRLPLLDAVLRRRVADLLTRLLVSYALSAPDDPPEVVADTLVLLLSPRLLGRGADLESQPA